MADSLQRRPTSHEIDPDTETAGIERSDSSLGGRVNAIAQEPLTPLTRILLILTLVLLLLSSVFIGLFAGVQHKLKLEKGRHDGGSTTSTITATSTATSTQVITTTSATTTTMTTTVAPAPAPTLPPNEDVCLTSQCILLSGSILSSLDTTQDPCENFYKFTTNGWLRAHPLPADKGSFGNFEALAQQNKKVIQRILESREVSLGSTDDDEILHKLRDFYSSCLNEGRLDEIGSVPLIRLVQTLRRIYNNEVSGKGPLAEISSVKKTDLTAAVAYMHSQGIESFFSFDIEGDVGDDPNQMVLWFSQANLGLPSKEYYQDESIIKVYQTTLESLLFALSGDEGTTEESSALPLTINMDSQAWPPWPWPPWGEDEDGEDKPVNRSRRARKLAKKVIGLEKQLAGASLDLDILYQDPLATYNPLLISNLTDGLPQINFPTYFSTFTPRTFPDKVIVTHPPYISSLSRILDDTPTDVVEAYLVVRAALSLSPYLGTSTKEWRAQRLLHEVLNGIKKGAVGDRSEFCISKVEQTLGFAVGRYFVNETFTGNSRQMGTKIITDIVKSFKSSLPHINWMDASSAKAAAEKADAIRIKVGYPVSPDTQDPGSIARYYSGVRVGAIHFFENMINAVKFNQYRRWFQLGQRRDSDAWEMYPSIVNAYFNPPANEIVFPAGILQPPFFETGWPSYISYGAFGHVAAHELTHAFDSAGRLYNQAGKLEKWWSNATSDGFKMKQNCIVKQFSAYTIDDGEGGKIHVNGNLTSGENIGDTGLIQAFRAWKARFRVSFEAGNEHLLPGLNFTREQLFFISFARVWANAMKPAAAVQRLRSDPHSPARYRVDGTVYNIPEFAEAFKCSKKAKLNPPLSERCLFW